MVPDSIRTPSVRVNQRWVNSRSASQAFTLIEMLVACACIAILAAMLLSAIPRVLSGVRATKCQSNLRQIGIAAQLWSADNNGKIVPVFNPGESGDPLSPLLWTGMLAPYMGRSLTMSSISSAPVYICPESPTRFGYGYNYQYLSYIQSATSVNQWISYAQVAHPTETVMIVDNAYPTRGPNAWKSYVRPPAMGVQDVGVDFKHPGKTANVLWLDGHVTAEIKESDAMRNDEMWDRN